jgi:hypothetical protein
MSRPLKKMYDEIANLTNEICASCPRPYSCCISLGCAHTKFWAKTAWSVKLKEQSSAGDLPFLGDSGCTVRPFLRPVCAIAVCRPSALPAKYYDLLREIAEAEQERWQSPEGRARAARIPSELRTNPWAILEHLQQGTHKKQ